jgi:hypothetical protein
VVSIGTLQAIALAKPIATAQLTGIVDMRQTQAERYGRLLLVTVAKYIDRNALSDHGEHPPSASSKIKLLV